MRRLLALLPPLLILGVWSASVSAGLVDPLFLPSPGSVASAFSSGWASGALASDAGATLGRALIGYGLSVVLGVPLGLVVGRVPLVSVAVQPTVDFFRSVPATALFPMFLFIFGFGDEAKIAIVVYACLLVVLVNSAYGALQVKATRLAAAKVMGASPRETFVKIVLPESLPGVFAGLRIALSLAFVLVVVSEMFFGTTEGLGFRILQAQSTYATDVAFANILVVGALGYLANAALLTLERRLLHWVGR